MGVGPGSLQVVRWVGRRRLIPHGMRDQEHMSRTNLPAQAPVRGQVAGMGVRTMNQPSATGAQACGVVGGICTQAAAPEAARGKQQWQEAAAQRVRSLARACPRVRVCVWPCAGRRQQR